MKPKSAIAILVAAALGLMTAAPAAAFTERPLPVSDYTTHTLCGAPEPGHASCFAVKLVPQTAAARAHSTPIGLTVHHPVEPASATDGAFGLRPQDLHDAYSLPTSAPAPQTVAIVDAYDDPTVEEDLVHYSQEFGLPACTHADGCFTKVNQTGEESPRPPYDSGWAGEIALDVETVHAVCENCSIILVEANNSSTAALEVAENTAVSMGATEVSDSFGGPEPAGEGSAFNHPGTVIAASTGDDGYLNWSSSQFGYAGHPNYPASSPDVVAVGGTRLTLNGGSRTGETVWNDGSTLGGGHGAAGSGCSKYPTAQPWQQAVPDWGEVGCGEKRAAADVASDADPYSGVAVYRAGSWTTVGGTSLASPIIASTFALAGGSGGVGYPAQTVYGHLGSSALHDVTSGSNGECTKAFDELGQTAGCTTEEEEQDCGAKLICRAAAGYDGPTGVGTPDGLSAFTPPAPSVGSVTPDEGDLGAEVTIEGEHLKGVSSVEFDGVAATHVVELSATELKALAPGHAPGQVDVTVTTGGGTSATTAADHFTYGPGPAIAEISPVRGPAPGGTQVTIAGERLGGVEAVSFGGDAATNVVAVSPTEVKATSPAHSAGEVDVTIQAHGEASEATTLSRFTYVDPPAVTSVEPSAGTVAGGTEVTIEGTHLEDVSAVHFGGAAATDVIEDSATELTATGPAHAEGTVDVTVTTPGGTSATSPGDEFQYLRLPVVEDVSPAEGPIGGGTPVTITGHDLDGASSVTFGGAAATSLVEVSATELTVTSPAHAEGRVVVSVTTPVGTSNLEPADGFTYVAAPASISPPTISGYPMEGRTLSASDGSWGHSPTSFDYQWLRCDSGGGNCGEIGGATAQTYQLVGADVGDTIEVEVTARNAGGQRVASSAATNVVVARTSQPFTWSGATPRSTGGTADDWTTGGNWVGGTPPTEATDIGTLTLPSLTGNSACAGSPTDACYQSENTIGGIEVEKISADDRAGYIVYGEPFSLGAGGIEASSGEGNTVLVPSFRLPISLSADQTWSVDGGSGNGLGVGGLELEGAVTGESHSLDMEFSHEAGVSLVESPDDEVGPVTITGADPSKSGANSQKNGLLGLSLSPSTAAPKLNAEDGNPVRLKDVSMLGAGTLGPLTVEGGRIVVGEPFPSGGETYGKLSVNGPLTLDSATILSFELGGTVPGEDYNQVAATGQVSLGGAELNLLSESFSPCPSLPEGRVFTLVTTTGTVEGTFGGLPDGAKVNLSCFGDSQPRVRINYTAHTVTATVLQPVPVDSTRPTLSGSAVEGQTLTASNGTWQNSPTSFDYKWLRCNAGCAAIPGATEQTYTLTSADVGDRIEVEVTASTSGGQASALSNETGRVVPRPPSNTSKPTIAGGVTEGEMLTAGNGSWERNPTSYDYSWLRCDTAGANCVAISGATAGIYFLGEADVGHTIEVEVTAHNAGGQGSATSEPTATVLPRPPVDTARPAISGSAVDGQTLTASNGTWQNSPTSFSYKWLRCNAGCAAIPGATEQTYTLTSADVGDRIEVEVTAHNAGGQTTAVSFATATVAPPSPVNTSKPTISGDAVEGQTLSADEGNWENSPTYFMYQWLRCDTAGANCVAISGAVGGTYFLGEADVGHTIEVEVTAHNAGGQGSATSEPTATVLPRPPVNTARPAISGSAVEGQTLTTSSGSWERSPTSFDYKWLRCSSSCAAIPGATEQTYTLTSADVGDRIEVEVTAHNAGGQTTAVSFATATVAPPSPSNTSKPTISGDAVEGQTLSADEGSWENSPTYFMYQWLRCDTAGANCVAISGATAGIYFLGEADVGHTIEVEVTAHNAGGQGSATSAPSAVVAVGPPTNTSPPTISGGTTEGETLSAGPGSWKRGGAFAYEWLRCDSSAGNCAPISGATGTSYTLAGADVGHRIEVKVSTSGAGGSASATSAATAIVAALQSGEGDGGSGDGGSGSGGSSSSGGSASTTAGATAPATAPSGSTPTPGTAVASAKATVKGGKAAIALRCTGSGPCSGKLLLEVASGGMRHGKRHANRRTFHRSPLTIGRASFSIPAGRGATVSVHLTGKAPALLRKAGKKGLQVKLAGTGLSPRQLKLVG